MGWPAPARGAPQERPPLTDVALVRVTGERAGQARVGWWHLHPVGCRVSQARFASNGISSVRSSSRGTEIVPTAVLLRGGDGRAAEDHHGI